MADRPDDLELVRLILTRQRRQGTPFDVAWQRAVATLPPIAANTTAAKERGSTLRALAETYEDWRCAFERLPPPQPPADVAARKMAAKLAAMRTAVAA